jgi:glc operon protein GlcG
MTLTLAQANLIVSAAIAKARQLNINVSVAVCDGFGHLVALNRMDEALSHTNQGSIGKAAVSAGTGLPSGDVTGVVNHPPTALVAAEGVPAIRRRGGLPISLDGKVAGACGVDGAPSNEQNEECARAGIAELRR